MEEEIARFMIRAAKFEFYLVNKDRSLAQTRDVGALRVVAGVNWVMLAHKLQERHPFAMFNFYDTSFGIFVQTVPQFLVKTSDDRLAWDSDDPPIDCWDKLLCRGYSQLRNNIAHGNKEQVPAPFTIERTIQFIRAGDALVDFIAQELFAEVAWERPIVFQ